MKLAATSLTALTLLSSASALPGAAGAATEGGEPSPLPGMARREAFNEVEIFAITAPAGCSILSCAQVIGQGVCIAKALDDDNWKNILKCAKAKQLCNCAECFKSLGTFLKKHGAC